MICPICKGKIQRKKMPYSIEGVKLGIFEADVCSSCGEIFFTEKSSDSIDKKAKGKGLYASA